MSLKEYQRKRNFRRTSEPEGKRAARSAGRQFVIQKHAASRLHYDFRLELDGVLKSWAVPKGPSLDPAVKSLAVQVEDHPVAYATFEGTIPEGEYGGGTVLVWDRGEWESDEDPAAALRKGRLNFTVDGERLHGGWALVRMHGGNGDDGKNWLLIKRKDKAARPGSNHNITRRKARSVVTGRNLDQIAREAETKGEVWHSNKRSKRSTGKKRKSPERRASHNGRSKTSPPSPRGLTGARKSRMPTELSPQLATAVNRIPDGDDWLHELKFDGYRLLAFIERGRVRLITRKGNDWTDRFTGVAGALKTLGLSKAILDGEVVSLNDRGVSDFQRLQNWMQAGEADELTYYIFDAPYFEGYTLRGTPLVERKELLARLLLAHSPGNDGVVRYSDHIRGKGPHVLEESCQSGLEGVVSKQAESPYETHRTRTWLKTKCMGRQEFVIGGYTRPQGSRTSFGALLVGYRDGEDWVFCGRVGTGFTEQSLSELGRRLAEMKRKTPPFRNPPTGFRARGVTWVEPRLVAEIEFTEWTQDGQLRHPSFQGLREDKDAREVVKETGPSIARQAKSMRRQTSGKRPASRRETKAESVEIAGVPLSTPDRILYPDDAITKQMLAEYYASVAEHVVPHVVERPLMIVRCPQGRSKQCFYQKHWTEGLPEAIGSVDVREKDETEPYLVIHDLEGLISLVQMNALELHPWGARADSLEKPDRIVFDFDPGDDVEWSAVKTAARDVRDVLSEAGLTSFLRTSGGKGLHVVVPIARRNSWDEVFEFAESIAHGLVRTSPERYVANMRKDLRRGKVFVDFHRNRRGATAIASYSTRARPGAPVAAPLEWSELSRLKSANHWTIMNVPDRLAKIKQPPWKDFDAVNQSVTRRARSFAARFAGGER